MKNMKRSVRRHHYARLKKKWMDKLLTTRFWDTPVDQVDKKHLEWLGAIYANTPCVCSCWMCCNPRLLEGPTLQEIRSQLSFEEDLMGL